MYSQPKHVSLFWLIIFNAIYISSGATFAIMMGKTEFLYYISIICFLILGVFTAHKKLHYSASLLWALSIWGLMHLAGGLISPSETWYFADDQKNLDSLWIVPGKLKYEHLLHTYGFAITTWLSWQTLLGIIHRRYQRRLHPTFGLLMVCATSSMGYASINEMVEFLATIIIPNSETGNYINTGWNLVANAIGAITASFIIKIRHL